MGNNFYLLIIFAGLLIMAVLLHIRNLAGRTFKSILDLIKLNEAVNYDHHAFLKESSQILQELDIYDYAYETNLLGNKAKKEKASAEKGIRKSYSHGDYSVSMEIMPLRHKYKGERRFIYPVVLETMFLLTQMDMLIKIKAINESFDNISKLQTLMLHDIKNVAQFIQTLSYNTMNLENEEDGRRLIAYLKESSPMLLLRAKKIMDTLEIRDALPLPFTSKGMQKELPSEPEDEKCVRIEGLLERLLNFYNIPHEVRGRGTVLLDEALITSVFDNLIKNIYDKSLADKGLKCLAEITEDNGSVIITIEDTGAAMDDTERVFEPFYTTKPGNLGVGLFQTRCEINSINGEIKAENTGAGVRFTIKLPIALLSLRSSSQMPECPTP